MLLALVKPALLGILEGLTEFLPVSSTGHLILAIDLFHVQLPPGKLFEIVIQLGAILAVVWLYRAKFLAVARDMWREKGARVFVRNVLVAVVPALLIGAALHRFIEEYLFSPWVVASTLIIGGVLIFIIEKAKPAPRYGATEELSWKTALAIGLCQCVAMIPGVSRSGATIMGAMLLGVERKAAAEFSFFLAVPTMLAASAFSLFKERGHLDTGAGELIAVGFIAAFISALLVIKPFVGYISRRGFGAFAWYRIILGAAMLALLVMRYDP